LACQNRQLRADLETSRSALSERDAEIQDLSFNLEEEKYRQSIGERKINTSFRAVYDEDFPSDNSPDDVFN